MLYIEKFHTFNVYIFVSLDVCIHPWFHHHNQGNKYIHIYNLQNILVIPPLLVCLFGD